MAEREEKVQTVIAERLSTVSLKIARWYSRRVFWADEQDLYQEALATAFQSAKTWDPAVGVPLEAYVWRACVIEVGKYLWRQSAPVHETDRNLAKLRGVHREELRDTSAITDTDAYVELDNAQWTNQVRMHLTATFDEIGDRALIERVLLEEEHPAHVASAAGVSVDHVYWLVRRARRAIGDNGWLFDLWRER